MRSTSFHVTALLALLALAGSGMSAAGCTQSLSESGLVGRRSAGPDDPNGSMGGETTFGGTDASAASAPSVRGSPLCGVTTGSCMPDDDGTKPATGALCVEPAPEAGASSLATACRTAITSDSYASVCLHDQADRRGTDGVACQAGSDCAPGFECIEGEKGGVCKRYCCLGWRSCVGHASQNGGPTFCDIQTAAATPRKVPVCMPLKKCKLLTDGECSEGETCAIVTEKGDSGCVRTGNAKVDEPCDEERCGADLACIGSTGDRRCYQLCRVTGNDCGPTQACMTGAIFQDTAFGVCKERP